MYAYKTTQINFVRAQENSQIMLTQISERKILKITGKAWGLHILLGNISGM